MKTFVYILISLFTLSVFVTSCNDDKDLQSYFPSEFHKILYIIDAGTHEVVLSAEESDYVEKIYVCKAGSDPSLEADCSVNVMSQDYVDEKYNASGNNINYQILPSTYYSMDNNNFHFSSGETVKCINLTFKTSSIKQLMNSDKKIGYVLPLRAYSENDSINSSLNTYLIELK